MSDNSPSGPAPGTAHRRSSITQAALSNLFQRGPSNGNGSFSGPSSGPADPRSSGRRLSVSTIGLSGTSPTTPATFMRRGSISTNSSIDESAIEDDDGTARTAPTTPFVRRMSFGASGSGTNNSAMRGYRPSGSPNNDQQGFNWSEQLRSRAESSVSAASRPSFSFGSSSPPRAGAAAHDRTRSVSDMAQPPAQAAAIQQPRQEKPKPDAFQERILKGDFYMD